jgi:hypothetical protein
MGTTSHLTASAPEVYADPREYQDQSRTRLTRDSYWYNHVSVIGGLKADLNERIEDAIQEVVSQYLDDMIDPEDGNYDRYVAVKMVKRASFGKYLPLIYRDQHAIRANGFAHQPGKVMFILKPNSEAWKAKLAVQQKRVHFMRYLIT